MSRELTREEKKKIRALVVKWCANYDREYGCLPLECECYMFGKCWTGAYCRYFREAVLPLDPALEAAFLTEGPRPEFKPCPVCGGPVPADGRMYQGFPGPLLGWAVSFYGLPLVYSNAFHIYPRHFWTFCPEVRDI